MILLPFLVKVAVFTPITRPYELINGPPEFPGQIRAHIRLYTYIVSYDCKLRKY